MTRQYRWYGAPAVAGDVASFALIFGGGTTGNPTLLLLGAAGFVIGAPINHLANRRPGRALGSLGIRTLAEGLAVGALLLDVLAHPCDGEPSCRHYPSAGLAVGTLTLLTALVVDDAFLARDAVAEVAARPARTTLAPSVLLTPSLAFVSVGGRF